jgi:threonine dehydrogenase-like Zn-dependent dehydrogenase
VPDPQIVNPYDAIIEITATTICGSDLHLYDGYVPTMREGDVLGHEPMGEVIEDGEIDPSVVVTHREDLEKGPELYRKFREKQDGCIKAVLTP